MVMPFLKRQDEAIGDGGEEHSMRRKSDEGKSYDLVDAVCEDIMNAVQNHNKNLLRQALGALVDYIKESDQKQDQFIMGDLK